MSDVDVVDAEVIEDSPATEPEVDWLAAIPFTREHEQMLKEIHSALQSFSVMLDGMVPMLQSSPIGAMLGI